MNDGRSVGVVRRCSALCVASGFVGGNWQQPAPGEEEEALYATHTPGRSKPAVWAVRNATVLLWHRDIHSDLYEDSALLVPVCVRAT